MRTGPKSAPNLGSMKRRTGVGSGLPEPLLFAISVAVVLDTGAGSAAERCTTGWRIRLADRSSLETCADRNSVSRLSMRVILRAVDSASTSAVSCGDDTFNTLARCTSNTERPTTAAALGRLGCGVLTILLYWTGIARLDAACVSWAGLPSSTHAGCLLPDRPGESDRRHG